MAESKNQEVEEITSSSSWDLVLESLPDSTRKRSSGGVDSWLSDTSRHGDTVHQVTQPETPDGDAEHDLVHVLGGINDHAPDINDLASEVSNRKHSADSSVFSTLSGYICDKCQKVLGTIPPDVADFWTKVPHGGRPDGCHQKLVSDLLSEMKKQFPETSNILKSQTTKNLIYILLKADLKDVSAIVNLKDFARMCSFHGPIKTDTDGKCILLTQLHDLAKRSLRKAGRKSAKQISWFAGNMSREEAKECLNDQSDGTFLVRMSSSTENFVISVIEEGEISHFEIFRDRDAEEQSEPYRACLSISERQFCSLVDFVEALLAPTGDFLLRDRDSPDEEDDGIACIRICPNLPLNNYIVGYK